MQKLSFERREGGDRLVRIFPVRLSGSITLAAESLDVSHTGVRIVSPCALAPDDAVELELELEPTRKVQLQGRPVWQQELSRAGHHMVGLQFVGCHEDESDLREWILEQLTAA